jgi:chromate reductase
MRILAISGSLRADSYNTALARAAAALAPPDVEIELYDGLASLPLYDQDLDQPGSDPPQAVRDLRQRIEAADALLVVTPEYNGSVTGVLKNAIDWASARHRGSSFASKTVAVAGATTGQYGAIWAQQDLRRVLGICGARVLPEEFPLSRAHEAFDEHGRLRSTLHEEWLRSHVAALVAEAQPVPEAQPEEARPADAQPVGASNDEGPREAALRPLRR